MKKVSILFFALIVIFSCKKNKNSNGQDNGKATVTFVNPDPSTNYPFRVILTSTSDTLRPYPNLVLDISVPAGTSVTRTDIPVGKRKLIGISAAPGQCDVGTPPISVTTCTTRVNKNIEYLANQNYTTIIQQ